MGRPSQNVDEKMIAVGMKIARNKGCTAIRIREVVDEADVNLGMFHYHFKNRKKFIRIILGRIYGEFFKELTHVASAPGNSLQQLRETLIFLGVFLAKNQTLFLSLCKDLMGGEPEVLKYSNAQSIPPHAQVLRELLQRCQKEKRLQPVPLSQSIPLFFGAITQPIIMSDIMKRLRKKVDWLDIDEAMSKETVTARIDIVLRGMGAKIE